MSAVYRPSEGVFDSELTCYDPSNVHLRHTVGGRLYNSAHGDHQRPQHDLSGSTKHIASDNSAHSPDKAANVVDRCHGALSVCRWVPEGLEEVFVDDDIALYIS